MPQHHKTVAEQHHPFSNMTSPCQASWPDDNGSRNAVNHGEEEYLQSFFRTYDALAARAQTADLDRTVRNEAAALHVERRSTLTICDQAVQTNDATIKEQTDRIALVSNHWFYGNSLYQPQLWLRGGCTGKIERARNKLERATRERPTVLRNHTAAQQAHAITAERLRQCQASYDQSSSAEAQRVKLLEELVQKHPSERLSGLQREVTEQQNTIKSFTSRSKEIDKIGREIDTSKQRLQSALSLAKQAETALQQVERLERENNDIATRCRDSSSSSSATPRGSPVVAVHVHGQHNRNSGGRNPRRPGSVHSQDNRGAQTVHVHRSHGQSHHSSSTSSNIIDDRDTELRNNNFIQMEQQQRVVTDALRKAQSAVLEGSRALEGAADQLIHYIRCHGAVSTGGTITSFSNDPPARLIVLGGTATTTATATIAESRNVIQTVRLQIAQLQSLRDEHAARVLDLRNDLRLARTTVQDALQHTEALVVAEKMRIVDALREQAMILNARSSCADVSSCPAPVSVAPSAPPGESPDMSSYHHDISAATTTMPPVPPPIMPPVVVVDAETPVLIPTERLSTAAIKDIPFATIVPIAPSDIWDDINSNNNNHPIGSLSSARRGGAASNPHSEETLRRSIERADLVK